MQFFEHRIRSVRAAAAAFNAWIDRHRAAIDRLHYRGSLALVFGTAAYATYHCALAEAASHAIMVTVSTTRSPLR